MVRDVMRSEEAPKPRFRRRGRCGDGTVEHGRHNKRYEEERPLRSSSSSRCSRRCACVAVRQVGGVALKHAVCQRIALEHTKWRYSRQGRLSYASRILSPRKNRRRGCCSASVLSELEPGRELENAASRAEGTGLRLTCARGTQSKPTRRQAVPVPPLVPSGCYALTVCRSPRGLGLGAEPPNFTRGGEVSTYVQSSPRRR